MIETIGYCYKSNKFSYITCGCYKSLEFSYYEPTLSGIIRDYVGGYY